MTTSLSAYTVGRGRPPLHTRFQKGQSGNPSGKPGPAKLAKQRFQRALYAALEGSEAELESSKPENLLTKVAKRIALDAANGRMQAVRLLLSLLDAECERAAAAEDVGVEDAAAQLFSLLQGNGQGSEEKSLEDILWPDAVSPPPCGEVEKRVSANADDVRSVRAFFGWGAVPRDRAPHPKFASLHSQISTSPQGGGTASPSSLVQGKTQGNRKIRAEQICAVPEWKRAPIAAGSATGRRAQLMTSAAAVPNKTIGCGLPLPAI